MFERIINAAIIIGCVLIGLVAAYNLGFFDLYL